MTILSYLTDLSSSITIPEWERVSIDKSIKTISTKLKNHFDNIDEKFVFGSFDRRTILRRSKDTDSDVDYIVSFKDGSDWMPQTMMNRLKKFAEDNYSNNEIYQSFPTIVLELSHIKFELVPAYQDSTIFNTIYIPAPSSSYSSWVATYPHSMKSNLNEKNSNNNYQIRKLVRLIKYLNVINSKIYSSYELEKYIVEKFYFSCNNLKDYFFDAIEEMPISSLPSYKESKVIKIQKIASEAKQLELDGYPYSAESKIKELFT